MSLNDVITSLSTEDPETILVTRRARSTLVDGIAIPGPTTTFLLEDAVIQPATGMQRVVGGRDMVSDDQGQHVTDVRELHTYLELKTREKTKEPDMVTYDGDQWVCVRSERWQLNDEIHWRVLITREMRGAS